MKRKTFHFSRFTLHVGFLLTVYSSPLYGQIQDNSFLLEEAYNQEAGVVQHINTFSRASAGEWEYSFTQEWPLGGIRHQLSYTIPVQHVEGVGTGLGDVALNYRYQLLGNPGARTVLAPRLSLVFPTGNEAEGRGAGALGLQANLPLTVNPSRYLVTHWNAGATLTPSARNSLGEKATTHGLQAAASIIWLWRPSLNFFVETVWEESRSVIGNGRVLRETGWVLNPGFRAAFNAARDLQIVPGIAYTIGLNGTEEDALFLYLSFEHPFKRQ